ncbi:recombinase family protein [Candidatus Giovannonibacteria bacterium]|nr:recombinase family protein [Candidatus Giovannonibacteria bacterium]
MNNQTKKFFIYTRKSTDTEDRQVRSIADQLAELRELAKKELLEIVDVFVEKQTAKIPGRPVFGEMIARIEKGEASGILAWHPDRLARNSVDGGKVIYLVDTAKITDLKFPTFWFDSTPQGKFMLSIAFSQSKYYIDNLSENIKRGHRQKLKNGLWPQMAPLGYLNDKTKNIVIDSAKAPLVKKTFEAYATGNHTLAQLRKIINDLGLKGRRDGELSISNFQYLLKNPFYYGLIRYSGEFYEGKHEPIITKKLFDEVQEVMARKSKPKTKELKPYAYRGFFRCGECGCFITTETQKGHNYLRCTKRKNPCSQRYVREDAITSSIQTELQKVSLSDDWADWMVGELEKEKTKTTQSSKLFAQNVKSEIAGVDEKLDKLMTAYLENALSLAEYQTAKNKLVNQKQSLKDKLMAFEQKANNRFERATRFILQSKKAKILAKDENLQSLRDCFKKVGSNFLIQNRALSFTPRGAWRILAESGFCGGNAEQSALRADHIFGSETLRHTRFPSERTRPLCDASIN